MENASKALLIASGILLAMLMVSVIIFAWGKFSDFYNNQDEIDETEELAKFNSQFTNFNREKVHGYELLSLVNKISDYNMRYSSDAKNNFQYNSISMEVVLGEPKNKDKFEQDFYYPSTEEYTHLFTPTTYRQNGIITELAEIVKNQTAVEKECGGSDKASKLAKSLSELLESENNNQVEIYANSVGETDLGKAKDAMQKAALENFKYITDGGNITGVASYNYGDMKNYLKQKIMPYYEYNQFKKSIFECTDVGFDNLGRVSSMTFEFKKIG